MGLSIMTSQGEINVPTHSGGGVNLELLNRIENLEKAVDVLKSSRSSTEDFGLSKISDSTTVTTSDSGLVLGAKENNASISGTLANKILKVSDSQNDLKKKFAETLVDGFINIDILQYAENVVKKGLLYAYTASIEETNVPATYYSYANALILKSGIGGRITVIKFDRYSGGRFTMNSKYNNENWSGWKEISVL